MRFTQQLALPFVAMVAVVVVANYVVQFPFQHFGLETLLTWGTLVYPLTFLINDLTNRFYGTKKTTQLIIVSAFASLILSAIVSEPRIALASALAFFIGQQLDNKIFNSLRQQVWWQAPLVSSAVATIIDTWLFYMLAFGGATDNADYFGFSMPVWVGWTLGDCLFKLGVVLVLLVPYRLALNLILSRQNAAAL